MNILTFLFSIIFLNLQYVILNQIEYSLNNKSEYGLNELINKTSDHLNLKS